MHTTSRHLLKTNKNYVQKLLAKKTMNSALTWKQTGSTHYNNATSPEDTVPWIFSLRDTIIYDANGNQIVFKTSYAHTGWTPDSITDLDSSVYDGVNLTEYIYLNFNSGIALTQGYRCTYAYLNGGKTLVETCYGKNWNGSNWVPSSKDSLVLSAASTMWPEMPNSIPNTFNYGNLIGIYSFIFDTTSLSWKVWESDTIVSSQCNDTTLTFCGKASMSYTTNSLIDNKAIYTFKSSSLIPNNEDQYLFQWKDALTGIYLDYAKEIFFHDANGNLAGYQYFEWDNTTNKSMIFQLSEMDFPDSHGNDSLSYFVRYEDHFSSLDSSSTHYTRTYDANGNNLITVASFYSFGNWTSSSKDINTFAQINTPVLHATQPELQQRGSIVSTPLLVIITAPNITGLMLYNVEGRIIASVKQPAAGLISLDASKGVLPLHPGVYIAKLIQGNELSFFKLSINR